MKNAIVFRSIKSHLNYTKLPTYHYVDLKLLGERSEPRQIFRPIAGELCWRGPTVIG